MIPGELAKQLVDLMNAELFSMDAVGRRIVLNCVQEYIQPFLQPSKPAAPAAIVPSPMDEREAQQYGETAWKFGKYSGKTVKEIPGSYLAWLADQSRDTWRNLTRYLNSDYAKRVSPQEPARGSRSGSRRPTDPEVRTGRGQTEDWDSTDWRLEEIDDEA